MKLKELQNFAKTVHNINFALVFLCFSLIVAICAWTVLFQSETITAGQWVLLELITVVALAVNVFILNFFCDVSREVQARLTMVIQKHRRQKHEKTKAATAATRNIIHTNAKPVDTIARDPRVIGY